MSGITTFAVGVVSGSGEGQVSFQREGSFPRVRDLGGLVISGSLTVLGASSPQGHTPNPGLTGSLTTLPDGSALIRGGANITVTTSSVPCADLTGRSYSYIDITASGGSGDVSGPGSATNLGIAIYDGTGGKTIKNSAVTIDASNNMANVATVTISGDGTNAIQGTDAANTLFGNASTNTSVLSLGGGCDVKVVGDLLLNTNTVEASDGTACITTVAAIAGGTTGDVIVKGALSVSGSAVQIEAANDQDAWLGLAADSGDDAGDRWWLTAEAGNNLVFQNDFGGAGVAAAMFKIQPAAAASDSVVQILGAIEMRGGQVTYGDQAAIHGAQTLAATANVAMGTVTAGGGTIKILELGGEGVARGDVTGAAGVITLTQLGATDATAARKTFNFTCVCTSEGTTNGDEGVITWTEAFTHGTQVNIHEAFAAKLTLSVQIQSNKWEIHLVNDNGSDLVGSSQATYNVQTTIVGS